MNVSATLNVFRLVWNPQLCLPNMVVSSFDRIPLLPGEIKALVLDKDNCFAKAHDDKVWPEYEKRFNELKSQYHVLVVSNSAGTNDDVNHAQAKVLESRIGVDVLRHSTKKPGCYGEILEYFKGKDVKGPENIAVIGDRLFTDVLMANTMGSYSVWVTDGVKRSESVICQLERMLYSYLTKKNV